MKGKSNGLEKKKLLEEEHKGKQRNTMEEQTFTDLFVGFYIVKHKKKKRIRGRRKK